MTFLNRLNLPKLDFMQNRIGGKIIKYQKSQALTSHLESFWSIVWRLDIVLEECTFVKVLLNKRRCTST